VAEIGTEAQAEVAEEANAPEEGTEQA